jgi:hypothetical protein
MSGCDSVRLSATSAGISHAYGGVLSALSIHYTLTPLDRMEKRWEEREIVSALYPDREEVLAVDVREVIGDFLT